jgi:hypothetical protein
MSDNQDNDTKVKDLLDAATRADLERWFALPSFEQLADQGIVPTPPPAEDPEFAERRKRQDEALAAVDPVWLEAHRLRVESMVAMVTPLPPLALRVDPGIARFDHAMIQHAASVAEPRDVERPDDLQDAMAERTPQALLRDLHRPEQDFYKAFEQVDVIADYRVDVAATITEAMTPSQAVPQCATTPLQDARALLLELRAERRQPWINIEMPLRRVTE